MGILTKNEWRDIDAGYEKGNSFERRKYSIYE